MPPRSRKRLYDVLSSQQAAEAVAQTLQKRFPGCRTFVKSRGGRVAVYGDEKCFPKARP